MPRHFHNCEKCGGEFECENYRDWQEYCKEETVCIDCIEEIIKNEH